ncbi:MAG: hypothetical protein ACLP1X_12955 [Polyangiaceae bacterium]
MKIDVLDLDRALTALERIATTLEHRTVTAHVVSIDLGATAAAIDDLCAALGLTRLSHLWGWRAWGVRVADSLARSAERARPASDRTLLLDAGTAVAETPDEAAEIARQCLHYPTDAAEIEIYRAHPGGPGELTRTTSRAFYTVKGLSCVRS